MLLREAQFKLTRYTFADLRQQLHQSPGVRVRDCARIKLRFLSDQRRHKVRVQAVLSRVVLQVAPVRARKEVQPILAWKSREIERVIARHCAFEDLQRTIVLAGVTIDAPDL